MSSSSSVAFSITCLRRSVRSSTSVRGATRHHGRVCRQHFSSTAARPQGFQTTVKPTTPLRAQGTATAAPAPAPAPKPAAAPPTPAYKPPTPASTPASKPPTVASSTPPAPSYSSQTTNPASAASSAVNGKGSDLTDGLNDFPVTFDHGGHQVDWARSFHGLSAQPFDKEAADVLLQPVSPDDVEVKPDGILYLPEIKYRRILNKAFGPGGWGLAPRGETIVTDKSVTREYALVAHGRLVSVARGEQDYFAPEGIPTAVEGCKSNALMRCCKDLGVASELWDPRFIRKFMAQHAKELFVEHVGTKRRKKIWLRKDDQPRYPFKETKGYT